MTKTLKQLLDIGFNRLYSTRSDNYLYSYSDIQTALKEWLMQKRPLMPIICNKCSKKCPINCQNCLIDELLEELNQ